MLCSQRAVFVVTCSFLAQALTHGLSTSMGVLYEEWKKEFQEQAALISWLSTSMLAILLGTSPIAGALTRQFGTRIVMVTGGILSASGIMAASSARDVRILYFTIPFMTGFGNGLAYTGAVVSVANTFQKHFTIFLGVASAGCGIGMILWPIILQLLVDSYTWRGTLMVLAGIQLHIIPLALLLGKWSKPQSLQNTKMAKEHGKIADVAGDAEDVPTTENDAVTFVVNSNYGSDEDDGGGDAVSGMENRVKFRGMLEQTRLQDVHDENEHSTTMLMGMDSSAEDPSIDPGRMTGDKKSKAIRLKTMCVHSTGFSLVWENCVFTALLPCYALGGCILGTVLPHIKSAAMVRGIPPLQAAFLISVVGVANTISRATYGLLIKAGCVHQMLLFASSYILGSISVFVIPSTGSYAVMVLCAIGVGIGAGVYIPLQLVVIQHIVPLQQFPGAMGISLLSVCAGIMGSSVISGHILDTTGSYQRGFSFAGGMGLCAGILMIVEHVIFSHWIKDDRWPPKMNMFEKAVKLSVLKSEGLPVGETNG